MLKCFVVWGSGQAAIRYAQSWRYGEKCADEPSQRLLRGMNGIASGWAVVIARAAGRPGGSHGRNISRAANNIRFETNDPAARHVGDRFRLIVGP